MLDTTVWGQRLSEQAFMLLVSNVSLGGSSNGSPHSYSQAL
jgi:hypothetical protein